MNQKIIRLSQRYVAALRKHLKQARLTIPSGGTPLRLGRQAVALGLETLELARIHEQALVTLAIAKGGNGQIKRAAIFFTEVNIPIVETHFAARQSKADLNRLHEALGRRTEELAATNRLLQCGIVRRKSVEAALRLSGARYTKLLRDSLKLEKELRQLTHRVMAAQEVERRKISHELQDEIAQTLLGINVRVLTLKMDARDGVKGLKNEIASTQRLVVKSAKFVRRVAREFRNA